MLVLIKFWLDLLLFLFSIPLCIFSSANTSMLIISFNPANASSCTPSTRSFISEVMLLQTTVSGWTWCVMNSDGTGHGKRMRSNPRHDEELRRTWLSISVASFSATGRQICAMCTPFITLLYGTKTDRLSSISLSSNLLTLLIPCGIYVLKCRLPSLVNLFSFLLLLLLLSLLSFCMMKERCAYLIFT